MVRWDLLPTSLDGCEELPSIIDSMSPICGARSTATAITAGDSVFLKTLYSVDMEQPQE